MELSTVVNLIKDGVENTAPQYWADLGAGRGLFTGALSTLLQSGKIIAVDKDEAALKTIRVGKPEVKLELLSSDLLKVEFANGSLDGVLMANSIHYIKDKVGYLRGLLPSLKKTGGRIIVVEYDMDTYESVCALPCEFLFAWDDIEASWFRDLCEAGGGALGVSEGGNLFGDNAGVVK